MRLITNGNVLFVILFLFNASAHAYTECTVSPNKVWLNLTGDTIWICFSQAACIYKSSIDNGITERHLNSMYSAGLSAVTANKRLTVRYSQDDTCDTLTATSTNDIMGFWYLQ